MILSLYEKSMRNNEMLRIPHTAQKILAALLALLICAGPLAASASVAVVTLLRTTGAGTYIVPDTWNNYDNRIEVIGGGAGGGSNASAGAGGSGGGAYAAVRNYATSTGISISYVVGAG